MFHDRDEFVHFVGYTPKKVHLLSMFARLFGERDVPSITYWGAPHPYALPRRGGERRHGPARIQSLLRTAFTRIACPKSCGTHETGCLAFHAMADQF